jgi:demethylmenaquinone methyltransferase / 2-methoxy-6-polyprenyl-1,4-benzoquinol methylase
MVKGTAPPGAAGEKEAARWVQGMFGRISGRYDLLNHLLSFQMDRWWRWRTVRRLRPVLERPGVRVIDLCCGTGDLALALSRHNAQSIGSDFSHNMLLEASRKGMQRRLVEADALQLPLRSASFDVVSVAFGFRNFSSYERGLEELLRITRPGGVAAILEFSQPPNPVLGPVLRFYCDRILPIIGGWISGEGDAYSYLPHSVKRFPGAEELAAAMQRTGFDRVEFVRMNFGLVALHLGWRNDKS